MLTILHAPTENVLQYMLDTFAPKSENLYLKFNVEKSSNIVFKHKSRRISTNLLLQGQPLKQVSEWRLPGCCINGQPNLHQ